MAHLLKPIVASKLAQTLRAAWQAYLTSKGRNAPVTETVAKAPAPLSAPPAALLRQHRVLLAEDNAVNRSLAKRLLEKLGGIVDVAVDGKEAVEMAERSSYALIVMDCQMPELSGYEATMVIRKQESKGCRTPIIALTAAAMTGDREKCLAAGMDDYISKPIDQRELRRICEKWISPCQSLGEQRNRPSTAGNDSIRTMPPHQSY